MRILRALQSAEMLTLSDVILAACLGFMLAIPGWQSIAAFCLALLNHNANRLWSHVRSLKELNDHQRLEAIQSENRKTVATMQSNIDRLQRDFERLNAAMTFKR